MQPTKNAVIIDTGSLICKVGIAGNDKPLCTFPSMIGKPKNKNNNSFYIGEEA